MQNLKKELTTKTYPLSLTNAIVLVFIVAFCMVFSTVFLFLQYEGKFVLDTINSNAISAKSKTVQTAIQGYLNVPREANAIIAHEIAHQQGDQINMADVQATLSNVINTVFSDNDYLNTVQFGHINGDYAAIVKTTKADNPGNYLVSNTAGDRSILNFYRGISQDSGIEYAVPHYNIKTRPWYAPVAKNQKSEWTPAFTQLTTQKDDVITYSSPVYNQHKEFVGVVSSEVYRSKLHELLADLNPFAGSTLLIVNEQNQIVSASDNALLTRVFGPKHNFRPHDLADPSEPLLSKTALALQQSSDENVHTIHFRGDDYYVYRFPIHGSTGLLKWQGITVVSAKMMADTLTHFRYVVLCTLLGVFIFGLLVVVLVLSKITSPLRAIIRKTGDLASHRWSVNTHKRYFPEIATLETTFWAVSRKLSDTLESLHKKIDEDPETKLLTREGLIKQPELYENSNLLALVHVSNMSTIVNSLGTEYGETFIHDFIARVRRSLPSATQIVRDKSDMFIIVFPGINQQKDYQRYHDMLVDLFMGGEEADNPGAHQTHVFSGNVGMVMGEMTRSSIGKTLMNAWIALKHAEKEGNAAIRLFAEDMHERELRNIEMHRCLNDAIHNHEFHLVLQPIVDQHDEEHCREGECLIRWNSPSLGFVTPDQFIPLAEETGLIVPLGKWIIEEACRELAALIHRGAPEDFKLHVNVSGTQLLQSDFAVHLMDAIARHGLNNYNICVEITESVLLKDIQRTSNTLSYLRRHGITIAIDDFGSGFSSLSYLHSLPFDSIKIDRTFVSGVMNNRKSKSVINSVIVLAQGFEVPLIAEGIEDAEVKLRLKELGCHKAQGYYFSRPNKFGSFVCADGVFHYRSAAPKENP